MDATWPSIALLVTYAVSLAFFGFLLWRAGVRHARRPSEQALEQRNQELALLAQVGQVFSSSLDLDRVLVTVLEEARRIMNAVACSLWLTDAATGELVCRQATGLSSDEILNWRLQPGEGIAGWVLERGESQIVPDVRHDPRYFTQVDPEDQLKLRSLLSVPLRFQKNVIGVIQVMDTRPHRFIPEDLKLLKALAASAAIAIENARLYKQAQQEIAERKQAESERAQLLVQIREQARQMEQIVATVPDGVVLLDGDLQVVLANPVAQEYLAALAGASTGDPLTGLGDRPMEELLTSPLRGLRHIVEIAEPEQRVFEAIARPLESGPQTEGWVLVLRDVTRQREVKQRVEQQARLATVGQVAAGIAHDFNNVMSSIVLHTQILLRTLDLPDHEREQLAAVNDQAFHASQLIQQILDFSRRATLDLKPVGLASFLKDLVKIMKPTLPAGITLTLHGSQAGDSTVQADPTRLQQVLMNLIVNARDALPDGGEIRLTLERINFNDPKQAPLPEMETGAWVLVRISDTGTGIPPDVLPHIFEPFFTTKPPGEGTGLGLAQVWGVVSQHGGHVEVNTEVGEGTTFTLYLPAAEISDLAGLEQAIPTLPQGEGQTILVVEDNASVRMALAESLRALNYQVLEANDGNHALQIMDRHAGDVTLVLSDRVMPGKSGVALVPALREKGWPGPIILLSGHPAAGDRDELEAQGVTAQLRKPVSIEELARTVGGALAGTNFHREKKICL